MRRQLHLAVAVALAATLTPPLGANAARLPVPCETFEGGVVPPVDQECCDEAPQTRDGSVLLPPGATEVEYEDVDQLNGPTTSLYANSGPTDLFYPAEPCPWSIGDTIEEMPDWSLDTELKDAGIPGDGVQISRELDLVSEQLAPQVVANRPDVPTQLGDAGRIRLGCLPSSCHGSEYKLNPEALFSGADIIFVHGLDGNAVHDALTGADPRAHTKWPADAAEFTQPGGYWKDNANSAWAKYIQTYVNGPNGPNNRYLTVAWSSNQWLAYGIHAFLSQTARAMAYGDGVVPAWNSTDPYGFCSQKCVVVSHSTGGLLVSSAVAVVRNPVFTPIIGNLNPIADQLRAHVAFAPAYSGSHYATIVAAIGWLATVPAGVCELARWLLDVTVGTTASSCGGLTTFATTIAGGVLTDLATPVTQLIWKTLSLVNPQPLPTLLVAGGHPTAMGARSGAKALSPLVKMLVHHGFDDGVLTMDSQCATRTDWRDWPSSFVVKPTVLDAAANAALISAGLPPLVAARAYDLGTPVGRAAPYYLDQVIGSRAFTPAFWKAATNGTIVTHFLTTAYWSSAACTPYVAPNGMVQQVHSPVAKAGADSLSRWPGHHTFLIAAADHMSPVFEPHDTFCYEETLGTGIACAGTRMDNNEEVRVVTTPDVYIGGLVHPSYQNVVQETVRGRVVKFKLFGKKYKWWIWKRTYHRMAGWESKTAADYVRDYVLR